MFCFQFMDLFSKMYLRKLRVHNVYIMLQKNLMIVDHANAVYTDIKNRGGLVWSSDGVMKIVEYVEK